MFIYVHMPFCRSKCIYCDFVVALKGSPEQRAVYLDALLTEIRTRLAESPEPLAPIEALYLGGGTPSLFSAEELQTLLACLNEFAPFTSNAEITMEANPEAITSPLADYRAIGLNRLSIGAQSMQPNELKRLSRIHSPQSVKEAVMEARAAGFTNISLDVMYGIPEQTPDSWQESLAQIIALNPEHLSMYGLQLEVGTPLETLVDKRRVMLPDDEHTVGMYHQAIKTLETAGYARYEFSNLAKPNYESRHNLNYWGLGQWWGFGVGAHEYMHGQRRENPDTLEAYLANPIQPQDTYTVTQRERIENAFIFGLRRAEGVHIPSLEAALTFSFDSLFRERLSPWLSSGQLVFEAETLRLTPSAISVSNTILEAFLLESDATHTLV